MKRFLLLLAVGLTLALGGGQTALAAPCLPTPLIRDGHALTAQMINPGFVTGPVVATGCDIGVYVSGGTTTISFADISDATYFGVAAQGLATTVNVLDSHVHDIGDNPEHTGAQHGIGVYFTDGAKGAVKRNLIEDYQKNGTAYTGDGTRVDSSDNRVIGDGPTKRIAQNGIQYSNGASGQIFGNEVSDNIYTQETSCTPECVGSTTGVIATGILVFLAGQDYNTGQDIASQNHSYRNQCDVCVVE
jgi:hypothetical protein